MELTSRPKFALSYYIGMGLLLLFLAVSIIRHIEDVRIEEAVIFAALAATILFAVFAAWRAVQNGR